VLLDLTSRGSGSRRHRIEEVYQEQVGLTSQVVILLSGWYPADPILTVGIAGLIAVGAWRILRKTTDILLEAVPKDINLSELGCNMMRVPGVQDVHDLHVWCITSGMYALPAMPPSPTCPQPERVDPADA
jgi:cobalt-zinc-cadmium efflux system protein